VWYEATYVVPALTFTGVPNVACCHPDADSELNVTVPSSAPPDVHRCPTCVPVFCELL
jgi:hypothetical protein